jgi:maleate isomerase
MAILSSNPVKRVGVILPPPNPTVEPEFHAALPADVVMYASRFPVQQGDLAQRNEGYRASYPQCVLGYRPMRLDAILVSCTGASYLLGKAGDQALSARLATTSGAPTITSSCAIQVALEALGVKALTLVSPYPDWLTQQAAQYWGGSGYRLDDVVQFGDGAHNAAYEIDDAYVAEHLLKLAQPAPDAAILMTGTGMPTIGAISQVRSRFTVPVLSSNLCGLWWLLRETGRRSGSAEFDEAARPLLDLL